MSAIIPFNFAAPAPALAKRRENSANTIFFTGNAPAYPTLSIKGKVFTMVKGDTRKVLERQLTDDAGNVERVPMTSLNLAILAANPKARVYYANGFSEGSNEGPTCQTFDGKAPDATSPHPQAKNCQVCPHAKWGSKLSTDRDGEAKGTACSPRIRLAVTDPAKPGVPFLLDVPPGSAANLKSCIQVVESHGKDFFEAAFKVAMDVTAATPKLMFSAVGLLTPEVMETTNTMRADPIISEILGVANPVEVAADAPKDTATPVPAPTPAPVKPPVVTDDEVDGVLSGTPLAAQAEAQAEAQAKAATQKAKATPKPKPPVADAAPKPAASSPAPAADSGLGALLSGLGDLLGATDD